MRSGFPPKNWIARNTPHKIADNMLDLRKALSKKSNIRGIHINELIVVFIVITEVKYPPNVKTNADIIQATYEYLQYFISEYIKTPASIK